MDTPRFNDAVLNHIIGTLNGRIGGILQEQQLQMQQTHADFNQWADNMKVAQNELAMQLEQARTYAGRMERWADCLLRYHNVDSKEKAEILELFDQQEQRLADGFTDAIKPVTPDHTCTNCYADQGVCAGSCAVSAENVATSADRAELVGLLNAHRNTEHAEPEPVPDAEPVRVDPVDEEAPTPPRPRRGLPKH